MGQGEAWGAQGWSDWESRRRAAMGGLVRRPRRRWPAAWRGSSGRRRPAWEPAIRPPPRRPQRRRRPISGGRGVRGVDGAASVRVMPTSTTAAPGLTISAVTRPGRPAATTTMSAVLVCAARSLVPVWHNVTVAFSVRLVRSRPSAADGDPAPDDGDVGTGDRHVVAPQQLDDAVRRARQRAGSPRTSLPRLTGCSPSASLAGSIRLSTAWASSPAGSGNWTMYPVQAGSAFSSSTTASTCAWVASAGRSRRMDPIPTCAQSRCLPFT